MAWWDWFRPKPPKPQPPAQTGMQLTLSMADAVTSRPLVGYALVSDARTPNERQRVGINGSATIWVTQAQFGDGMNVDAYAEGYTAQWQGVGTLVDPTVLPTFTLDPIAAPVTTKGADVGHLVPSDIYVFEASGAREWKGVGTTAFCATGWWLTDRPRVHRAFDYAISRKLNFLRVLGNYNKGIGSGVGVLISTDYPDYDQQMLELVRYAASRNTRILFDCFADMNISPVRPTNPLTAIDQPAFYQRMAGLFQHEWNVLLGGGNQWPGNGWSPDRLGPQPAAPMFSLRGSPNEEQLPWLPPWSLAQFDLGRNEFWRKGKAAKELRDGDTLEGLAVPGPLDANEPIGIANYADGGTTNDPSLVYDMYGSWRAFGGAVATVHLRRFISDLSVPEPGSAEDLCVQSAVRAHREIPIIYARGAYARGSSPTEPYNATIALAHTDLTASRTYELRNGPTSIAMALGRMRDWKAIFQDGAKPVVSYGCDQNNPNFFDCTRG